MGAGPRISLGDVKAICWDSWRNKSLSNKDLKKTVGCRLVMQLETVPPLISILSGFCGGGMGVGNLSGCRRGSFYRSLFNDSISESFIRDSRLIGVKFLCFTGSC